MRTYYSITNEINNLPKGNIYKKIIKGNVYMYYQYSENNIKHTRLLQRDEYQQLIKLINKRIELETELKLTMCVKARSVVLSNNAKEYTGYVMSGDDVVAEFENGNLLFMDEKRCPLSILRNGTLESFLKLRVIDVSRTNARLLKKMLNIKETEDERISLCSYAASISDNFWFKPKHSKLKYEDISFTSDMFFDLSLKGLLSSFPKKVSPTPELTTTGSYEKGWKNNKGEWWLYKVGTKREIFSELFYSRFMKKVGYPTVRYEVEDEYIKCKNFANRYNYEPMAALLGSNDDYDYVFNHLLSINKELARPYLILVYYDAILFNVDRHNENCGVLRSKKTGRIISLAPNFDDNLCLISRTEMLNTSVKEGFLNQFASFIKKNDAARELLKESNLHVVTRNDIYDCYNEISMDFNYENIESFIMNRYEYLTKIINN